jgi:hypothetical protein
LQIFVFYNCRYAGQWLSLKEAQSDGVGCSIIDVDDVRRDMSQATGFSFSTDKATDLTAALSRALDCLVLLTISSTLHCFALYKAVSGATNMNRSTVKKLAWPWLCKDSTPEHSLLVPMSQMSKSSGFSVSMF